MDVNNSSTSKVHFTEITGPIMEENEQFLYREARETVGDVIGLVNDSIRGVGYILDSGLGADGCTERCVCFFINHILMPLSYGIYLDLLAANLPTCFIQLRLMVESLAQCYLADLEYPGCSFFQDKLDLLNQSERSLSSLLTEAGRRAGMGNRFVALWGKLSQDWAHTRGFVGKIVDSIVERDSIAPWALGVPMRYENADLHDLDSLRERVVRFRELLSATLQAYEPEFSSRDYLNSLSQQGGTKGD